MKNANIFIDVNLTLVDYEEQLLPGVKQALRRLVDNGCHLFLWSSAGARYAKTIAEQHGVAGFFEGFVPKPDVIVDDNPGTVVNPIHYDVNKEGSWKSVADAIIEKPLESGVVWE